MGEGMEERQNELFSRTRYTGEGKAYNGLPFVGFFIGDIDGSLNLAVFSLKLLEKKGFSTAVLPVLVQGKGSSSFAVYQSPEATETYDKITKLPEFHTLRASLYHYGDPSGSKDYLALSKLPDWDLELKRRVEAFFWERSANHYGDILNRLRSNWWDRLTQSKDIIWAKTMEEGCKKKTEALAGDLPKLTVSEIYGLLEKAIDKLLSESS